MYGNRYPSYVLAGFLKLPSHHRELLLPETTDVPKLGEP